MSTESPVDPVSAGLRRARERMAGAAPGLVELLAGVLVAAEPSAGARADGLRRPDVPARAAAERAASAVESLLPALIALDLLRTSGVLGSWDGLLHRRIRVSGPGALVGPWASPSGADDAAASQRAAPLVRAQERGGWVLLTASVALPAGVAGSQWPDGALVVHELARRSDGATGAEGSRDVVLGLPTIPADGLLRLSAEDVARWAALTGDGNALHLVPGAAAAAGVPGAASEGVIAHGMLTAALSLAVVPLVGDLDLRLLAPVAVPVGDAALLRVDPGAGGIEQDGRRVLSRRSQAPA